MASPEDIFLRRLDILMKLDTCPRKRIIIALAGAPGSGKSTVAEALSKRFNKKHTHQVQIVPMVFRTSKISQVQISNESMSIGWLSFHKSYFVNNAKRP